MEKAQSLDERGLKGQRSVMKWQSMKVVNLVHHCRERGLTSTGSKAVLIQRLQDYENNDNFAEKIALLKSSDIESNTDDDYEIEEVSVDGHDIANDSGCPTSDSEEVHYRRKTHSTRGLENKFSTQLKIGEDDSDMYISKRQTTSSEASTTRSQLRAALSIENYLSVEPTPEDTTVGCVGCESVSQSVNSLKKEMTKIWRRDVPDGQVRNRLAAFLPISSSGSEILETENYRLKTQNMKLMREVANLRRELEQTSNDKASLVRIVCLLAKDKSSKVGSQELEVIDSKQ